MITFIIFILLTAIEAGIIFIKWNEIEDAHSVGKVGAEILGIKNEFNTIIGNFVKFLMRIKYLIWIPITLMLLINIIIATILSTVYSLIIVLISLLP